MSNDYEEIITASEDEAFGGVATGLPNLDREIGPIRGFPIGRITLLTGKYSVGKSSLALFTLANAQRMGMTTLYVDTEMTFDKGHAEMCGVDTGDLKLMRQTEYAEKVFDTIEKFMRETKNAFVVLDSYSGLSIMDEMAKDAGGADYGAKTKMLARFFRKIKVPVFTNKNVLVVLAHEYPSMTQPVYMILVGGDAMAKTPSLWIDLKKKPGVYLKSGDERVGEVIEATMKKNKIGGKKYATADLQFVFGKGWNPVADLVKDLLDAGVITRTGNTFYHDKVKIGTKGKLDEYVNEHKDELQTTPGV